MIRVLIDIYIILILLDAILSYIPNLKSNLYVQKLRKICEFSQKPIRKYMPQGLPLDPSPIAVILLLKLIEALW